MFRWQANDDGSLKILEPSMRIE